MADERIVKVGWDDVGATLDAGKTPWVDFTCGLCKQRVAEEFHSVTFTTYHRVAEEEVVPSAPRLTPHRPAQRASAGCSPRWWRTTRWGTATTVCSPASTASGASTTGPTAPGRRRGRR